MPRRVYQDLLRGDHINIKLSRPELPRNSLSQIPFFPPSSPKNVRGEERKHVLSAAKFSGACAPELEYFDLSSPQNGSSEAEEILGEN